MVRIGEKRTADRISSGICWGGSAEAKSDIVVSGAGKTAATAPRLFEGEARIFVGTVIRSKCYVSTGDGM